MSEFLDRVREQAEEFNEKLPGGSFADGAAWLASRLTRENVAEVLDDDRYYDPDLISNLDKADEILALLTGE